MELEDLKSNWQEMSLQLEMQRKLTDDLVMKITRYRSNSVTNSIINFEILGMAISAAMLLYVFLQFEMLEDWLSFTGGIVTSIILMTGLVMSFILIRQVKKLDLVKSGYRQTLTEFNRIKKIQYTSKWVTATLAPVLAIAILPTFAAIHYDKSLLHDLPEYGESLAPGLLIIPVAWYLIGRFYSKKITELNELLDEYGG